MEESGKGKQEGVKERENGGEVSRKLGEGRVTTVQPTGGGNRGSFPWGPSVRGSPTVPVSVTFQSSFWFRCIFD